MWKTTFLKKNYFSKTTLFNEKKIKFYIEKLQKLKNVKIEKQKNNKFYIFY